MKTQIVGIGEALWDMLPAGKQLGGAPANFAYHVKQLGFPAQVVSAVGDDELGHEILNVFTAKQIPSLVQQVNYPTGTVQVSLDEAGVPSYEIKTNVAWDNISFTPEMEDLAAHTQAVCFGSLAQRNEVSRAAINRFLDAIPEANDVLKIFDINLRQQFYTKEILHESLCKCNVLKINDEELEQVSKLFNLPSQNLAESGASEENLAVTKQFVPLLPISSCVLHDGDETVLQEKVCRKLLTHYQLKLVILTCGEKGSFVFTPEETSYFATPKVDVVDTVGAGDAFTAAFVAGILQGNSVREAHQLAVNISAYVCTKPGAMPDYDQF